MKASNRVGFRVHAGERLSYRHSGQHHETREDQMQLRKFSPTMALITGAVLVASAAAALGTASMASASGRPAVSGTEHLQLMTTSATSKTSSIIATGVFTAGGTDTRMTSSTESVALPGGTFVVTHSKGTGTQRFNPRTCLLTVNEKGTYKLSGGTGAYAGISGTGTYHITILAVGAKSAGTCSKTVPPPSWQQVIDASGPVSLP